MATVSTNKVNVSWSLLMVAAGFLSGCANFDESDYGQSSAVATDAKKCSARLAGRNAPSADALDSRNIRLLNWNVQKGRDSEWTNDLGAIDGDPNLIVLQEVPFNTTDWDAVTVDRHRSFAPGYRTKRSTTGVMTVSAVTPLTQCNLVSQEPWLRSAKATVITEFGLSETDETLLVVNIHAVNFTFGIRDFEKQIREAVSVLESHSGPILLSGDFNTWHSRRDSVLNRMTDGLGLETLSFEEDHRKRVFGFPLDHIYVRGLDVVEATTSKVSSSDHNPMSALLQIYPPKES